MEKSKSRKKRRAAKSPLNLCGQLAMPGRILPWERDLLAVLIEAVDGSAPREKKASTEVAS